MTSPRAPRPAVSFEFFPPKTPAAEAQLWAAIRALEPLLPDYVSVTYGAGGGTRDKTYETVVRIFAETHLRPAAHLTCVGQSRTEIEDLLRRYWTAGIRHIVALRGDPPAGGPYQQHPDGFANAAELVAGIKRVADFEISVAAYPETHPQANSPQSDIENLKRKFDAGADRAITQFFFDNQVYLDFLERAAAGGVHGSIVPGILPVTQFAQMTKFAAMCGAGVPDWLEDLFEGLDEDPDTRRLVAAMVATEQIRALQSSGINEFHIYTLNRADLTLGICRRMGFKPAQLQGVNAHLSDATPPPQRDPNFH
jgi:methylenetetrahydrofolate reductase (NADPH)